MMIKFYLVGAYLLGIVFGAGRLADLFNIYVGLLLVLFLLMGVIRIPTFFKVKRKRYLDLAANYFYVIPGFLGFYQLSHQLLNLEIIVAILCWLSGMSLLAKDSKTADFLGEKKTLLLGALFFLMTTNIVLMNDYLGSVGFLVAVYPVILMLVYYDKLSLHRAKNLFGIINPLLLILLFLIGLPIS